MWQQNKTLPERRQTMKTTTASLLTITVLLFACSDADRRTTVKDTYANGQAKSIIYKTLDERNTYYEIAYDSLGRILKISPYAEGKKNGSEVFFRPDSLGIVGLLPFKNDKREGFIYEFYPGQQIAFKGEAQNAAFNGISTWFHKNGTPKETGTRINDQKEGEWTEYYENGQLKAQGTYLNGRKNKDWTYWNSDNSIDSSEHE